MGYDTRYKIMEIIGDAAAFRAAFDKTADEGVTYRGLFEDREPQKWYEHEEHIEAAMLASMSGSSGTSLVTLHGEGEEQGDVWDKTFVINHGCQPPVVIVNERRYAFGPGAWAPLRALRSDRSPKATATATTTVPGCFGCQCGDPPDASTHTHIEPIIDGIAYLTTRIAVLEREIADCHTANASHVGFVLSDKAVLP